SAPMRTAPGNAGFSPVGPTAARSVPVSRRSAPPGGAGRRRDGAGGCVEVSGEGRSQAMTTMRWFLTGGPPRGTPAPGRRGRRPTALLLVAGAVLRQAGCRWGPPGWGNGWGKGGWGNGSGLLNNMRTPRERLSGPRNPYTGPAVPVETAPPL